MEFTSRNKKIALCRGVLLLLLFLAVGSYSMCQDNIEQHIIYVSDTAKVSYVIGGWELADSLPDGKWTVYQSKNKKKVAVKGEYKNLVKDGIFYHYDYVRGNLFQRIEYSRGIKHGLFLQYTDGHLTAEGFYYQGKKSGLWIFRGEDWHVDTAKSGKEIWKLNGYVKTREAIYKNDTLIRETDYFKNGNPQKIITYNPTSGDVSSLEYFYENGKSRFSVRLDGSGHLIEWLQWYPNGHMHMQATGKFIRMYYQNVIYDIIKDPLKYKPTNGTLITWSENGSIIDQQKY